MPKIDIDTGFSEVHLIVPLGMAKLIALDIGGKRTGIAETDPLQIIAQARETISTNELIPYLQECFKQESYEAIIVGDPKNLQGGDSDNSALVRNMVTKLKQSFPQCPIHQVDERFTSKIAMHRLIEGGVKKSKRKQKGSLDAESAAIILEGYLQAK